MTNEDVENPASAVRQMRGLRGRRGSYPDTLRSRRLVRGNYPFMSASGTQPCHASVWLRLGATGLEELASFELRPGCCRHRLSRVRHHLFEELVDNRFDNRVDIIGMLSDFLSQRSDIPMELVRGGNPQATLTH